ncbi:nicotinate-nucleotide adenylyltransferase [Sporolactobacillus spathodeae]|uniref:Probable nicotinate-nucleotide adenylyltransferase n=1 Tax=Sporolactobacillus spathodeae TaxID=1465502 RepID=A0ABS2Q6F0_9BACL|nr:nicotinate-nucleotide adenylyltransferase [Sporolactobacillus spathodeae]MBM7657368.1 nicotinate-nucleotide adenylyltransferase [Sporolactobacillus spathodeae]
MKKIGLMGGTFDPPHLAHLIIAEEALETCGLDAVWFIPSYQPPHVQGKFAHSSAADRVEMVRRAIRCNDRFKLEQTEIERKGPSYTVDTLRALRRTYPECSFYFIIGADMINDLPTWHGVAELCKLTSFIGFSRPGYVARPPAFADVSYIEMPTLDISSSALRKRLSEGRTCKYFLTDTVLDYIKERQLYGINGSGTGN